MNRRTLLGLGAATAALGATTGMASAAPAHRDLSDAALARSLGGNFESRYAAVSGTRLHYVTGGSGRPLVLLPGWPQTWWQYHKMLPRLARRYRVIAVDLRGMGGSGKPAGGYDKKTMAGDIRELVHQLGYDKVDMVGHDIGSMVGYSLAANHPDVLGKLALLDVTHPDEHFYDLTLVPRPGQQFFLWWFAFNQVHLLPEQLLTGRFRLLIDHLCGLMLENPAAIDERDRRIYANAYDTPDAIRAGNGWYQTFGTDIADQQNYQRLRLPILAAASPTNYQSLVDTLRAHADDVRPRLIEHTGHYLTEEQPDAVAAALEQFFG